MSSASSGRGSDDPAGVLRTQGTDEAASTAATIAAVRAGDTNAFSRLVRLHQRRLFSLVVMIVRDRTGAEEVTQDAFVRAFTRLELYDERRPFYPWLSTIAVRLAQTWLARRARTTAREGAQTDAAGGRGDEIDPLAELIADERERRLWRSVQALPLGERTVVSLYYRQDLSVNEIAQALGVTTGTVKTLLFRARRRLRRTLTGAP